MWNWNRGGRYAYSLFLSQGVAYFNFDLVFLVSSAVLSNCITSSVYSSSNFLMSTCLDLYYYYYYSIKYWISCFACSNRSLARSRSFFNCSNCSHCSSITLDNSTAVSCSCTSACKSTLNSILESYLQPVHGVIPLRDGKPLFLYWTWNWLLAQFQYPIVY